MTKRHSDDAINAVIFAANQAREALLFLVQSPLTPQTERALFMQCFEKLRVAQERADGIEDIQQPTPMISQPISRSSGVVPPATASLNHAG